MSEIKQWKDVVTIISGKNQKIVEDPNGKYPIYGSGGIIGRSNEFLCRENTVIVGRKGTIDNPIFVTEPFWNIDTAFGVVPGEHLIPKYLYYFCRLFNFKSLDKSTGRPSVSKSDLLKIKMPVPTIPEQISIVGKLEELLSQLDEGVSTIKLTQDQLEVYRQAVLKDAFSGKYTASEQDCVRARIDSFADVETGATPLTTKKEYYEEGTISWVASGKINDGLITSPTAKITELALKETNCKVFPAHTLLVAMYGEGQTRGKCAELMIEAATNQAIAAIVLHENCNVKKDYLKWYLTFNYQKIRRKASGGVQPNLNLGIIKALEVPLYDIPTQERIIAEIESRISVYDSIAKTLNGTIQQTEVMRKSILKHAYEGRL